MHQTKERTKERTKKRRKEGRNEGRKKGTKERIDGRTPIVYRVIYEQTVTHKRKEPTTPNRQHPGHHLVQLADELKLGIVGQVLQRELPLAGVAGIRLAKHGVTVPGHHATGLEGGPHKLRHLFVGHVGADLLLHVVEPLEHLLVGQAVEGTRRAESVRSQPAVLLFTRSFLVFVTRPVVKFVHSLGSFHE